MKQPVDPELLRTFMCVADTGTFTAAARQVHRSQAAVSLQMRKLQEDMGARLFEKSGRCKRLTADGEKLRVHAHRILRAYEAAAAAFDREPLSGHIRFAAPDDFAATLLPDLLARFSKTHPEVGVELYCNTSANILRRIEAGSLDMALITSGPGDDFGRVIQRGALVWIGSPETAVYDHDPLPLALFPEGCRFRKDALHALEQAGIRYRLAYTCVSLSAVTAAVGAGLAVSVLPHRCLPDLSARVVELTAARHLPALPDYELSVWRNGASGNTALLDHLENYLRQGSLTTTAHSARTLEPFRSGPTPVSDG
ncbi:LysR substrate-binding domain-containing protein [Salinisphaera sp. RV14]|uniref:LysR substrate-binding domain-containing protein n=1 Tax=unclassified Salinisphaera TaxID=2649847 RepID=UPI003F84987B